MFLRTQPRIRDGLRVTVCTSETASYFATEFHENAANEAMEYCRTSKEMNVIVSTSSSYVDLVNGLTNADHVVGHDVSVYAVNNVKGNELIFLRRLLTEFEISS